MRSTRKIINLIQPFLKDSCIVYLTKIMLCYNKIGDQDKFNRLITYNVLQKNNKAHSFA